MNQRERIIKTTCQICKEREVWVHQVYDRHLSDWMLCEIPVCEKCRREIGIK